MLADKMSFLSFPTLYPMYGPEPSKKILFFICFLGEADIIGSLCKCYKVWS